MITILVLGPALTAVSGVTTHLNQLFHSSVAQEFRLVHFQVGSEGRAESTWRKLVRFSWSPVQFLGALLRHRPQIVHVNTSMEPKSYWRDIVYVVMAKLLGKRVLYQVHGGALPQVFFRNPVLKGLLRQVLRMADEVVLLAQVELQEYRRFDAGLALRVIPNAIDIIADPLAKNVVHHRPLALVYVGRLAEAKGIFDLLDALALVRQGGSQATLAIAGGGPADAALRQRVEQLQLQDAVVFLGPVFGEEKDQAWLRADVFGFPTYHNEGLPYALLEAMAARTPALICPVAAIPDVMQDGVHGLFVPPRDPQALADAILRLDADRALLRDMGQASRSRIENHYSLARLAADFRDAYLSLSGGQEKAGANVPDVR